MTASEPTTLIISVDRAGHVNQCLAFCERIGWAHREPVTRIPAPARTSSRWERFVLKRRRRAATAAASPKTREPGLLRIVASGAAAEAVAAAYRSLWGADLFAVFIGRPHTNEPVFDASVIAHHALLGDETFQTAAVPGGGQLVWMRGVYVRAVPPAAERSGLAAVIGGDNKAFTIDAARIVVQLRRLTADPERAGWPLTLVFSRRTPPSVEKTLTAAFPAATIVGAVDRAGYVAAQASAREFAVTPDSISMVCELCATGRPVHAFDLAAFDDDVSTARFARDAIASGLITPIGAPPSSARPDVSFDVSDRIAQIHRRWLEAR